MHWPKICIYIYIYIYASGASGPPPGHGHGPCGLSRLAPPVVALRPLCGRASPPCGRRGPGGADLLDGGRASPPCGRRPLVALICLMVGGSRLAPCGLASPPLWSWAPGGADFGDFGLFWACFGLVFGVGGWLGALVALIWLIWALVGAFGGPFWAQFCPKSPIVSVIWGLLFLTAGGATKSDPSHMGGGYAVLRPWRIYAPGAWGRAPPPNGMVPILGPRPRSEK